MALRITYNAPVVLTMMLAAAAVQLLGEGVRPWFAAWPEFVDKRAYFGLFTHTLGHADWNHLLANFAIILLLGPLLEERFGSFRLFTMIALTALITGLINVIFFDTMLVGASGIVFMMIFLSSTTNIERGELPLTFLVVAVIYFGREFVSIFKNDQISQMAHIVGGLAGAAFGFLGAKASPRPPAAAKPAAKPVAKLAGKPEAPSARGPGAKPM